MNLLCLPRRAEKTKLANAFSAAIRLSLDETRGKESSSDPDARKRGADLRLNFSASERMKFSADRESQFCDSALKAL